MKLGSVAAAHVNWGTQAVRIDTNEKYSRSATGLNGNDVTMVGWFQIVNDRNVGSPFMGVSTATGATFVQVQTDSDGTTLFLNSGSSPLNGVVNMTVGVWYYIGFIWTASTSTNNTIYWCASGASSVSKNATNTGNEVIASTWSICLGGQLPTGGGSWFDGRMAGIKIWSAALSDAEIAAERFSPYAARTANLWGSYPFDTGPSTTDASGNGRTLTVTGSPSAEAGPSYA